MSLSCEMIARRGHNAAVNRQDFGTPCWQLAMNTTPILAPPEGDRDVRI
jgi:hypothetical protein